MKHTVHIIMVCTFLALPLFAANPTSLSFLENSFWSAKIKAEKEHKSYMIIYETANCSPCKWMDENTFSDLQVTRFINRNLVAAKVDIYSPDGQQQRRQYQLTKLPTIIIFDEYGQEKGRLDEPSVARGMLDFMKKHVSVVNNILPVTSSIPEDYNDETVQPLVPQSSPESPPSPVAKPPVANTQTLSSGGTFSVQIGAFQTKESAYAVMGRLNDAYTTAATIYPGFTNGKNWYKVSIGVFHDRQKADIFKGKMREEGFSDAFVKVW